MKKYRTVTQAVFLLFLVSFANANEKYNPNEIIDPLSSYTLFSEITKPWLLTSCENRDFDKFVKYSIYFGLKRVSRLNSIVSEHIRKKLIESDQVTTFYCSSPRGTLSDFFQKNPSADAVASTYQNGWRAPHVSIHFGSKKLINLKLKKILELINGSPQAEQTSWLLNTADSVFHEFLHVIGLESGPHLPGSVPDPKKDIIYACSYYAFPTYFGSDVFEVFGFAGNCQVCASAQRSLFSQRYRFKIPENISVSERIQRVCSDQSYPIQQFIAELERLVDRDRDLNKK